MTFAQRWLVRPYVWHELPGWGRVYDRFVGDYRQDSAWAGERPRAVRGKLHGYEMELDLSRWSERATYFLGRFYDLENQLLLRQVLRPGGRFVDVGGNIGMITLLAARLVGPAGVVDVFEPNPACADRIRATAARNRIAHVRVHRHALGATDGAAVLTVPRVNTGEGTLTAVPDGSPADRFEVPVRAGDAVLAADPRPTVLIKIDVEGFECEAIAGLTGTLRTHRPLVVTEVVPEHLARAGRSPADLFRLMAEYGYEGRSLGLLRRWLRHDLVTGPASPERHTDNVLWVPGGTPLADRVR